MFRPGKSGEGGVVALFLNASADAWVRVRAWMLTRAGVRREQASVQCCEQFGQMQVRLAPLKRRFMGKICHFERRQKRFFFGTSLAFVLSSATKDMPGTPGL
jgi:hypothetical protein